MAIEQNKKEDTTKLTTKQKINCAGALIYSFTGATILPAIGVGSLMVNDFINHKTGIVALALCPLFGVSVGRNIMHGYAHGCSYANYLSSINNQQPTTEPPPISDTKKAAIIAKYTN